MDGRTHGNLICSFVLEVQVSTTYSRQAFVAYSISTFYHRYKNNMCRLPRPKYVFSEQWRLQCQRTLCLADFDAAVYLYRFPVQATATTPPHCTQYTQGMKGKV
jgi:hypothetical protein